MDEEKIVVNKMVDEKLKIWAGLVQQDRFQHRHSQLIGSIMRYEEPREREI